MLPKHGRNFRISLWKSRNIAQGANLLATETGFTCWLRAENVTDTLKNVKNIKTFNFCCNKLRTLCCINTILFRSFYQVYVVLVCPLSTQNPDMTNLFQNHLPKYLFCDQSMLKFAEHLLDLPNIS